jgi:hypothetical protein
LIIRCSSMLRAHHSIRLRLTKRQVATIWPGLDALVSSYSDHRDRGSSRYRYPFRLFPPHPSFDRGLFSPETMEQVITAQKHLLPKWKRGGRVQLNAIQIRSCIFAVRVHLGLWRRRSYDLRRSDAATRKRLGFGRETGEELRARCKSVARALERHSKRATRLLKSCLRNDEFDALTQAWKKHLRWMRLYIAYFKPLPPVRRGRKKRLQQIINILVGMADRGLRNEGYESPPAGELRRLMRMYARYSRRERQDPWPIEFLLAHSQAFSCKWHLAKFVLLRRNLRKVDER